MKCSINSKDSYHFLLNISNKMFSQTQFYYLIIAYNNVAPILPITLINPLSPIY